MHKKRITAAFLLLGFTASAQKGIDQLVRTEKDFAAYSVSHSTKEAFEKFIDSASIMFENGQPVRAVDYWARRQKRPGVLNWHPQFAEVSLMGSFGYTTGPWTYRASPADTISAYGQYSTVWAINKSGEWKFLADFGVDNSGPATPDEKIITAAKQPAYNEAMAGDETFLKNENGFNARCLTDKQKAYKKWLSRQSILNRNGSLPAAQPKDRKKRVDQTPDAIQFTTLGWGFSAGSADMAYTYGKALVNGKDQNYLRVWRKEKKGWKIALEVLRY